MQSISAQGDAIAIADTGTADPLCFFDDCYYPGGLDFRNGAVNQLGALPGGLWVSANAIGRSGLIAGTGENGQTDPLTGLPQLRAAVWHGTTPTDLGTMEGGYNSAAFAVNDAGVVAGYATNTIADPYLGFQQRAMRSEHGIMQDLGTLDGGTDAIALLENNRGQISGISVTSPVQNQSPQCSLPGNPAWEPFVWDHGKMTDLGNFGGTCSMVNAINDRGQIAGQSFQAGNTVARAFLWQSGSLHDLGTLGGSNASAEGLNDAGDVVGYADVQQGGCNGLTCLHHGFFLTKGVMHDLKPLSGDPCSRTLAINNTDQAVGASIAVCGGADTSALLWENGGPPINLNTTIAPGADLKLFIALAINDRGTISGNGILPNGDVHAFVLVPCASNCAEVHLGQSSRLRSSAVLTERMLQEQHYARAFRAMRSTAQP